MIAIVHNKKGWSCSSNDSEKEVDYYSSLAEVMSVAYRKEYEANSDGEAERCDSSGDSG